MIAAQVRWFSRYDTRHIHNHNFKVRCFVIYKKLKMSDGVYGNDGPNFADNFVEEKFCVKDLKGGGEFVLKSQAHPVCFFGGGGEVTRV